MVVPKPLELPLFPKREKVAEFIVDPAPRDDVSNKKIDRAIMLY